MQTYDMNVSSLISCLISQWKFLLKYIIISIFLGCLVAFFYSENLATEDTGAADKLPVPVLSDNEYTISRELIEALTNYCIYANEYVDVILNSDQLTALQRKEMNQYADMISKFAEEDVADVLEAFDELPVYIYEDSITEKQAQIEKSISEVEHNLMAAEEAALLIEKMGGIPIGNEALETKYLDILDKAMSIADYKIMLDSLQKQLNALNENPSELYTQSREIDNAIEELYQQANELNNQLYAAADRIAREKHLIFSVTESDDTVKITLSHGYSASSASEVFQLIVVFFTLAGICSGAIIAICNEAKKKQVSVKPNEG